MAIITLLPYATATARTESTAETEYWEDDSKAFAGYTPEASCRGCHDIAPNSALGIADFEVPDGDSTANVQLNIAGNASSYSWRVRRGASGDGIFRTEASDRNYSLDLGATTGDVGFQYCIAQNLNPDPTANDGVRQYFCGSFTVGHAPPEPENTPPTLTAPTASPINLSFPGNSVTVTATATDPDTDDTLTYDASALPAGVVDVQTNTSSGVITLIPQAVGNTTLTVSVDDGTESSSVEVPVVVSTEPPPPNTPSLSVPVSSPIELEFPGEPRVFTLGVTDPDPDDDLTYGGTSASISVVTVVVDSSTGQVTLTPIRRGETTLTFSVTDGNDNQDSAELDVLVTAPPGPINRNPVLSVSATPPIQLTFPGDPVNINTTVTDPDEEDELRLDAEASPDDVVSVDVNRDTGQIRLTPLRAGNTTLIITVSDSAGGSDSATLAVVVSGEPTQPPPAATGQDLYYSLTCSGCHEAAGPGPSRSDTARWQSAINAAGSFDALLNRVISGIGNGMPAFPLSRFDRDELGLALRYLIGDVEPETTGPMPPTGGPNEAPVAEDDEIFLTGEPGVQELDVLANDTDPNDDPLLIRLDTDESQRGVALEVAGNKVRYATPQPFTQTDTFSYRAQDPDGLQSNSATVTIGLSDADGDGRVDTQDNCPATPNPDQLNADGDQLGDACDPSPDGQIDTQLDGSELAAARELVQGECLSCHNNPATGSPQLGDNADWQSRLDAKGLEALIASVINGLNAMPALSDKGSPAELRNAVLYLSGISSGDVSINGESGSGGGNTATNTDTDLDGVADADDNCPRTPNSNQLDTDNNEIGDLCETTADQDGDGYVFGLDDDETNANRLPSTGGSSAGDFTGISYFSSSNPLRLGAVARAASEASSYARGGVMLPDADFLSAAATVYPGTTPALDNNVRKVFDIINIDISQATSGGNELIMQLSPALPLSALLRRYEPASGQWTNFASDGLDQIASAQTILGGCPATNSPNYVPGLNAGHACVRLAVTDGGPNDLDALADGTTQLGLLIGAAPGDGSNGGPGVVQTNPSKGGGALGWLTTILGAFLFIRCWLATVGRIRAPAIRNWRHGRAYS